VGISYWSWEKRVKEQTRKSATGPDLARVRRGYHGLHPPRACAQPTRRQFVTNLKLKQNRKSKSIDKQQTLNQPSILLHTILRMLQTSLRFQPTDIFNMGIRTLAPNTLEKVKSQRKTIIKHYMDLEFNICH
jgi:hypothetical protein